MQDNVEVILEILEDILGKPKKISHSRLQLAFDCIECDEDRHKGNLEISLDKDVYHCWSCGISGVLGKLIDDYGNKKQKKIYKLLKPTDDEKKVVTKKPKVRLPEGYTKFSDSSPFYPVYHQAKNYLHSRGITDEMIEKYQIGFCDKGELSGRIIIPSFDINQKINYYIARSWDPRSKLKYKNPQAEKDKIIFNEHLIDWDKDIYLVEGAFDSIFLDNSIPMLGKTMSELLFHTIYERANGTIIVALDGDAFKNAVTLYRELNGGRLYKKIKIVKLPLDKDVCDLRGQINDYYVEIKE